MKGLRQVPRQVWWAQLSAVCLWFLVTLLEWTRNPGSVPGLRIPVTIRATEAAAILLVTTLFICVLENVRTGIRRNLTRLLLLLLLYPGCLLANMVSIAIRSLLGYTAPPLDSFFLIQSLHLYFPLLLVLVSYAIVKVQLEIRGQKERTLRAEALAQQSRWMMLRYQVNPHFLFNALNTIRALIGSDDRNARRIVTELSDFFRYSLAGDVPPLVTLKEEMEAVKSYLEIQKVRFGERLAFEQIMEEGTRDCLVPVFAVQTLVENGIKYGMKTSEKRVEMEIRSHLRGRNIIIEVWNTGKLVTAVPGADDSETSGTGLSNLRERIIQLDSSGELLLSEVDGRVLALLTIQVKKKENESLESTHSG